MLFTMLINLTFQERFYTNQNYIGYPTRYTKHRLEEINDFAYNFFYNPEIIGLDFNSTKENSNEKEEHIHNIVNGFIAFINKCDEVIKKNNTEFSIILH